MTVKTTTRWLFQTQNRCNTSLSNKKDTEFFKVLCCVSSTPISTCLYVRFSDGRLFVLIDWWIFCPFFSFFLPAVNLDNHSGNGPKPSVTFFMLVLHLNLCAPWFRYTPTKRQSLVPKCVNKENLNRQNIFLDAKVSCVYLLILYKCVISALPSLPTGIITVVILHVCFGGRLVLLRVKP